MRHSNVIEVHISNLRRKLGMLGTLPLIETRRYRGYRLLDIVEGSNEATIVNARLIIIILLLELAAALALTGLSVLFEEHTRMRAFDTMLQAHAATLFGAVGDADDPGDDVVLDMRGIVIPKTALFDAEEASIMWSRFLISTVTAIPLSTSCIFRNTSTTAHAIFWQEASTRR